MDFKIMPVGISNAGGWRYAFIYDLVPRQFTDLIEKSRFITEPSARKTLILNFMSSVGAVKESDLRRLFGWNPDLLHSVLEQLMVSRLITSVDLIDHDSEKQGFILSKLI
jgi:hypothetical protein